MTAVGDQAWARRAPARVVRSGILRAVFGPLIAGHARVAVAGAGALDQIGGPVVFVANHASHVDTPVLLGALAPGRRRRTLVAAAADYFYTRRSLAVAVSLAFGAVPVARREDRDGGRALEALARLIEAGFSVVVFAEGTRSRTGRLGELRSGAAALAGRCGVPLVPVHLDGTAALMAPGRGWMVRADPRDRGRRHAVTVAFGAPLHPPVADDLDTTMDEVRRFMLAHAHVAPVG